MARELRSSAQSNTSFSVREQQEACDVIFSGDLCPRVGRTGIRHQGCQNCPSAHSQVPRLEVLEIRAFLLGLHRVRGTMRIPGSSERSWMRGIWRGPSLISTIRGSLFRDALEQFDSKSDFWPRDWHSSSHQNTI